MSISYNWVNPMCSLIGVLICVLVSYIPGKLPNCTDKYLLNVCKNRQIDIFLKIIV